VVTSAPVFVNCIDQIASKPLHGSLLLAPAGSQRWFQNARAGQPQSFQAPACTSASLAPHSRTSIGDGWTSVSKGLASCETPKHSDNLQLVALHALFECQQDGSDVTIHAVSMIKLRVPSTPPTAPKSKGLKAPLPMMQLLLGDFVLRPRESCNLETWNLSRKSQQLPLTMVASAMAVVLLAASSSAAPQISFKVDGTGVYSVVVDGAPW
jgi:hypothetical protein